MVCDWLSLDSRHCAAADKIPKHGHLCLIVKLKHFHTVTSFTACSWCDHTVIYKVSSASCLNHDSISSSCVCCWVKLLIKEKISVFWWRRGVDNLLNRHFITAGNKTSLLAAHYISPLDFKFLNIMPPKQFFHTTKHFCNFLHSI